jgi:glucose/arabinose dehydrogenase
MRQNRSSIIVSALAVAATQAALAGPTAVTTTRVASGLVRPIGVYHAPGDTGRIFIIEKQGRIRILDLDTDTLLPTPFLDVDAITGGGTSSSSEQGLLGLAFHPDYANNGLFYIDHTNNAGDTVIAEYQVSGNPDVADAGSRRQILFVDQPFSNHNGGFMQFGFDGYLYIGFGDGGSANDPNNNAQNTSRLLGKLLRLDIDGDDFPADSARNYAIPPSNPFVGVTGAAEEIWAYGLRNPWRCSFDRQTGDLWIGDVGQNAYEEVDFQPADSAGGENYGWRCYEGLHPFNTSGCAPANTMVFPVHEYTHAAGCSITGGYIYRGCRMPENHGEYFFADYCASTIWSFTYNGVIIQNLTNRTADLAPGGGLNITGITSFGEDANGEIYICDQTGGEVFQIVPEGGTVADQNGDGTLDFFDVADFLDAFSAQDPSADLNGDNAWDFFDVQEFLEIFSTACP